MPDLPPVQYAAVPGARLAYVDSGGTGTPLVLLHAATGSVESWAPQLPAFTAAGYRVIACDRRGRGRSTVDATTGPQPGTAADDLSALLAALGVGRCHLLGTAAGAFVALDFAVSWPERLGGLILANSIYGIRDPEFVELVNRLRPQPAFNQLPQDVRELGPSYRAADPEGVARWQAIEHAAQPAGPPVVQGFRQQMTFALAATLTMPALLLTGGADLFAPPPVQQRLAERLPQAETVVIAEAGHSSSWEQPEVFNRTVLAFLKRVDGQA